METSIGMVFNDFVMVASDTTNAHSILVTSDDYNKTYKLSDKLLMSVVGESGDTAQFAEFIAKNIQLYKMRNDYELSPKAAANYTRRNLADYLRSRTPFMVNLLIAGRDNDTGESELYFMDYLGSLIKLPFAAHGYGGLFTSSLLDRHHRMDMTEGEAYELMKSCVQEIQKRLIINMPKFNVKVINKDGIKDLDVISIKKLPE